MADPKYADLPGIVRILNNYCIRIMTLICI